MKIVTSLVNSAIVFTPLYIWDIVNFVYMYVYICICIPIYTKAYIYISDDLSLKYYVFQKMVTAADQASK